MYRKEEIILQFWFVPGLNPMKGLISFGSVGKDDKMLYKAAFIILDSS
jgi:hypothetical protein